MPLDYAKSSDEGTQLLIAQWIAPMSGPLIRDGGVAFSDGIIRAVGPADQLRHQFSQAQVTDLGESVLLPGLVNAHVHLELSTLRAGAPPARFVDWLLRIAASASSDPTKIKETTQAAIKEGVAQCVRFGVTTVGDISRHALLTRPLLKESPLRVVSFGEVLAMAQRRHLLEERLVIAADQLAKSDRLRIGISPHAPYSVEAEGFRRCLQVAREGSLPLTTHLAESLDEARFLSDHSGPFRDLWNALGAWDENVPRFDGGAIRFAKSLGLLDYPTLLAHVNYCDDGELALLAAGRASVVYCPRTHAYFGHPPHRWRDMLAAGINVAVGTDSTASAPDLNVVDDLRLLHRLAPHVPAQILWEMATTRPAIAMGLESQVGSITIGKSADFLAFTAAGADPLATILETDHQPAHVWIAGRSADILD
ncbi:MAG TPA: amidohydrolase family protein [Humisphaera sp.]|jgi:cytosine/adenosine deaminase-related metal-dependent hydrolase|nr:amidohydrolase family protein [Humisphaera sp.]